MTDELAVIHRLTSELLERLARRPPRGLADALNAVRDRRGRLRKMERRVDDE